MTEYVWYSEVAGEFYVLSADTAIDKLFSGKGPMLFMGVL